MKKILMVSVFAAVAIVSCKKKDASVSELRSYSAPTILLPFGEYYSMPVGGVLPEIGATAYDSFYNEETPVVFDQSKLDNTVPGLYLVTATSKNHFGMASSRTIYVAVTDVATPSLAGLYVRMATMDTVSISMVANGFYRTNDVAANGATDTSHVVPAYFVQTSPVAINMPAQGSKFGTFFGDGGTVTMSPTDTTIEYVIRNSAFAPTTRIFKKI